MFVPFAYNKYKQEVKCNVIMDFAINVSNNGLKIQLIAQFAENNPSIIGAKDKKLKSL